MDLPELPKAMQEQLQELESMPKCAAPFKRDPNDRIFVNRDLNMNSITHVGFDMDFTLAEYVSPAYEQLTYGLSLARLQEMGYPATISSLAFDPSFPLRGLFLDTELGNLLKVDGFGYVVSVVHGRTQLSSAARKEAYPHSQVPSSDIGTRFQMMNTLFNLVDACLYADLVHFFESGCGAEQWQVEAREQPDGPGVRVQAASSDFDVSYVNLWQDVRAAIDHVHQKGALKKATAERFGELVRDQGKDTVLLLQRLRASGKKLFLLTNSGYAYTDKLMGHMLHPHGSRDWKEYFDYIIVGARKPAFFAHGTTLREVDLASGALQVSRTTSFRPGCVYNGGSIETFAQMSATSGPDVLYVGDHIFSDIIISKKKHMWRNLLVVRELGHELQAWAAIKRLYTHLQSLECIQAEAFRSLDSSSCDQPDLEALQAHIKATVGRINDRFNVHFGSLFKGGAKPSFFSMQVQRYADLYCRDVTRLLSYPFCYYFSSAPNSLPHEVQMRAKLTE